MFINMHNPPELSNLGSMHNQNHYSDWRCFILLKRQLLSENFREELSWSLRYRWVHIIGRRLIMRPQCSTAKPCDTTDDSYWSFLSVKQAPWEIHSEENEAPNKEPIISGTLEQKDGFLQSLFLYGQASPFVVVVVLKHHGLLLFRLPYQHSIFNWTLPF